MMKFKNYSLISIFSLVTNFAQAHPFESLEINFIFKELNFNFDESYDKNDLHIKKYTSSWLPPPISNDFDIRTVFVVFGKKSNIDRPKAQPIHDEFILKREKINNKTNYRGWSMSIEEIIYYSQRNYPGYIVECVVAGRYIEKEYVTISECYPFGEKKEFLKILSAFGVVT